MGFFHCLKEGLEYMKTTIENLIFPESIKIKLKMKVSLGNLKVEYINGHIIKFNKTNLSIMEPHKIIISNNKTTLVALLYEDEEKIYLPRENAIISFTKYISIINAMNKN